MAGITDEELDSYLPKPLHDMQDTPESIRARGIIQDIYARHGIPAGTPLEEAQGMIAERAQKAGLTDEQGQPTHAWANPEEAAAAQAEYAARGKTPAEVEKRWQESIYLLPPQGYDYHQNYTRDALFLKGVSSRDAQDAGIEAYTGTPSNPAALANARVGSALESWDSSNNAPLYRKNWREGTYESTGHFGNAAANVLLNPDLSSGSLVNLSDLPFNFFSMQGSGEGKHVGDSMQAAMGEFRSRHQNRLGSQAPILDLPANATPQQRAARLRELQKESATAAVPSSAERWKRSTGFVPPPVIRDTGDAILATLDGTQFIPGMKLGKTVAQNAAKLAAKGVAKDMGIDAAVSTGIAAAASQKPGRTWSQYLGLAKESADDLAMKSAEQVAEAEEARRQRYDRTLGPAGVSSARDAAYKRLQESGKAPIQ